MSAAWPALDRLLGALRTAPARTGSVISTVYGDAILDRGGALALSDLLALMGRLGAPEGVVRTAVSRLARDGVLQGRRTGRRSAYALTAGAEAEFRAAVPLIYGALARPWDGVLRIGVPETAGERAALEAAGFRPAGAGVLISPDATASGVMEAGGPREVLAGLAARAWPVAALGAQYAGFLEVFGGFEVPVGVGPLDAMAARVALVHAWRRIALRDPRLPDGLLPPGWPGHGARRRCMDVYAALAEASEAWLDGAGCGADPLVCGPAPNLRWV